MTILKRTNINSLLTSKWLTYAIARTGVNLPNCFTYATARISEIVGYNQSLDGNTKVRGAGNLWETHHENFKQSSMPCIGALMIWQGGTGNYGHVAVVESIGSDGTIYWSQSNYGGKTFEYLHGNPQSKYKAYALNFKGYLVHKDIKKDVWNRVPSTAKKVNYTFEVTSTSLTIYQAPTYNAKSTGLKYVKGDTVILDYTYANQGRLWGSWVSKSTGKRRWMKIGYCNSAGAITKPFGNIK